MSAELVDWQSRLPAEIVQRSASASLPQSYEAAKNALERCAQIDEAKVWSDKASALASYARQANDQSLRIMAQRIHLRAVARIGELLLQIPASKGGYQNPGRFSAAGAAGLSERATSKALALGRIPRSERELAIEADPPPSVRSLERRAPRSRNVPAHLFRVSSEFYRALSRDNGSLFSFCTWLDRVLPLAAELNADEQQRALERIATAQRGLRKLRAIVRRSGQ